MKDTDPKPETPSPSIADAMVLIAQTLAELKSAPSTANSTQLDVIANFLKMQNETRPHENVHNPPLISFLNPYGERDRPRPELKCKMHWVGYEMTKDGLSHEEIALLNQTEPGEYRVTKSNGSSIPFTIHAVKASNGKIERMTFHFPCKTTDDRHDHRSMVEYLKEILFGKMPSTDELLLELTKLRELVKHQTV